MRDKILYLLFTCCIVFTSCDFLFGNKEDDVTDEIFEQGSIDPNLVNNEVGYVPILPIWDVEAPIDIVVGFDEMVYVVNVQGLNVYDLKGELQRTIAIQNATDVIQDRKLQTYVTAKITIDTDNDGFEENVACVYKILNASSEIEPVFTDTIIHPYADLTRTNSAFRGADDEAVEFTGLAVLADNTLYVSRKGPRNSLSSTARPDNAILFFDDEGNNIAYANGLNPVSSSLKSTLEVSAIATRVGPPQAINGISTSADFVLLQSSVEAEFKALNILKFVDPDGGVIYTEDVAFTSFDPLKADGFMYAPFRFKNPADVYIAPDASKFIFIVDAELDSLFQFAPNGLEGVNPPISAGSTKQVFASFGGEGAGPFQFNEPSGVCYFDRTVFVADKGNNRILRYRLSSDIE